MGHCCDCSTRAGAMSLLAAALLTLGWMLNVAAILSCQFVTVNFQVDADSTPNGRVDGGLGLYCTSGNWNGWTQTLPFWTSAQMISARNCGVVATLMGFIIMILAWMLPCLGCTCAGKRIRGKCIRVTIASFSIACCILVGFMFLVNSSDLCSDDACSFSRGGGFAVGAMLSYFFAGCLLCVAPSPKEEEEFIPPPATAAVAGASYGQETVTIEKTEYPDGTVTVKKTTTHPDGSKTVEETTNNK